MSEKTLNLTPQVYDYLLKNSLREPDILKELRIQTAKMSMHQMQISPEQGQFMRLLVELIQAKKTLDIGTFTGYSALTVALGLGKEGRVITCDRNIEWTKMAKKFWQLAGQDHKIELRLDDATNTLNQLVENGESNTFDFIFIDADKKNYPAYYELSLQLLKSGGLIAIDNVLQDGRVADESFQDENTVTIRNLNQFILNDDRVSISLIPISDGLTLVRKR